jgi:subtilisin family serine protease
MRIRPLLLLFFLLNVSFCAFGQDTNLYYVFFEEKIAGDFEPQSQFTERAILRRQKQGIEWEKTDWPVHAAFVAEIGEEVMEVRYRLKWFNAVSVAATPQQIEKVAGLPFVREVQAFGPGGLVPAGQSPNPDRVLNPVRVMASEDPELDTLLTLQRELMQADLLREAGLTGKGVRIAVIDVGFKEVNTHPSLQHLMKKEQIVATRNFYKPKQEVYKHHWHGLGVLGCIAGKYGDRWIGIAPDAEFLLARTEHKVWEKVIEEDHWLAAAEWADSMGADMINSSLGYHSRYTYSDLDGKTTLVSRAAAQAAQKGILVVTSAGNEGSGKWRYITAPADASEVLAVGGTLPFLPYRIRFSSYGPNSKQVMKPNISAPAYVLVPHLNGNFISSQGTSFSGPLIAGLAACLMEKYPEKSSEEIFTLIEQMGHLYPYYDYSHGYGIPQPAEILIEDSSKQTPAFTAAFNEGKVSLVFASEVVADSVNYPYGRVLYYHFEKPNGSLDSYEHKIVPIGAKGYQFQYQHKAEGVLRIWFAGTLVEREE